jgi:flagellar biosynthesis anti-sigma factor FlgM
MRVSSKPSSTGSVGNVKSTGAASPAAPASPVNPAQQPEDALNVSSTAQFIAVAKVQIDAIPDVRTERVEALRVQLDSERYNPDGEAVADGILKEHIPPPHDP